VRQIASWENNGGRDKHHKERKHTQRFDEYQAKEQQARKMAVELDDAGWTQAEIAEGMERTEGWVKMALWFSKRKPSTGGSAPSAAQLAE